MENYGYKTQTSKSLTLQPMLRRKYFQNESCIFSMFLLYERHKFVLDLVNWLTEKMIIIKFKIIFWWYYEMLYIWDHLQNCFILELKLLHLWEYEKNCYVFTQSAAFPEKSTSATFSINYVKLKLFNQLL